MSSEPLVKKLDLMIGGTFMYNTREITIRDISMADGQVKFITNGDPVVINKSAIKEKIDDFLPVGYEEESLPAEMEDTAVGAFRQTDDKMEKLESIIMTNIERVQDDRGYLDQAKQVNQDVNTILKMNQQKIDLFREVRKTKLSIKK